MITVQIIAMFMVFAVMLAFCVLLYTGRPKATKAEFISDMYRLQMKWSKRGCYTFAQAINAVIEAASEEPEPEPATEYGKNLLKSLKNYE
jgi:hypothetical protein